MRQSSWGIIIAILALAGCGPEALDSAPSEDLAPKELGVTRQEAICGVTDDRMHVNDYTGQFGLSTHYMQNFKGPVGVISGSTYGKCTGVLVGYNIFMTSSACAAEGSVISVEFGRETAGPSGPMASAVSFPIGNPQIVETSGPIAIVRLDPHPSLGWAGDVFGISLPSPDDLRVGSRATIIQFAETGALKKVHSGSKLGAPFAHNVDTKESASLLGESHALGAPILNDSGEIVGIHHTGGCTSQGGSNQGTNIAAITAQSNIVAGLRPEAYIADFNGDGYDDRLIRWANRPGLPNQIEITYSNGAATFINSSFNYCTHATARLHTGDVDGDGFADLICHDTSSGSVWVEFNAGNGFSGSNNILFPINGGPYCNHSTAELHVGDFNGDLRDDLLCHDRATGHKWIAYAYASGFLGYSSIGFNSPMNWCLSGSAGALYIADVNGDGRKDLVCHDPTTGGLTTSVASSTGAFAGTSSNSSIGFCVGTRKQILIGRFDQSFLFGTVPYSNLNEDLLCQSANGDLQMANASGTGYTMGSSQVGPTFSRSAGACKRAFGTFLMPEMLPGDEYTDISCIPALHRSNTISVSTRNNLGGSF